MKVPSAGEVINTTLEIIEDRFVSRLRVINDEISKAQNDMCFETYIKKDYMPNTIIEYLKRKGYSITAIDEYEYKISW